MSKQIIKKLLGTRGTIFARKAISVFSQKKSEVKRNNKSFLVDISTTSALWKWHNDTKWESLTFNVFDKFLDPQHSYIDLGAFIGHTVLYGSQIAKHCYAIEPNLQTFKELKKNIKLNNNLVSKITLYNSCISDVNGKIKFFTNTKNNRKELSSESSIFEKNTSKDFLEVKSNTLPHFYKNNSIKDCNFIKIDVEGAEFKILSSMKEILKENKPTLLIEFHPFLVKNPLIQFHKLQSFFDKYQHIYNIKLEKIKFESIFNFDFSKTFQIVLSDT